MTIFVIQAEESDSAKAHLLCSGRWEVLSADVVRRFGHTDYHSPQTHAIASFPHSAIALYPRSERSPFIHAASDRLFVD